MNKISSIPAIKLGCQKLFCPSPNKLKFLTVTRNFSEDNGDQGDARSKAKEKLSALLNDLQVSGASNIKTSVDNKLAKPKFSKQAKRDKEGKIKSELPPSNELDREVVNATEEVANLSRKKTKTQSELLQRLKQVAKDTKEAKRDHEVSGENLESIFSSIKVDRPLSNQKKKITENLDNVAKRQELTMEQMAFLQKRAKLRRAEAAKVQEGTSVDLHSGIKLGIFTGPLPESSDMDLIPAWRACHDREMKILSTPPPRNALEEMILQTNQGKLWHFPINNEQGLDYSDDPFYNHVFLEHHLEPWCPTTGPVRQFMESVCQGLSQNPYMASQKKLDTILWFKTYFERPENQEILVHSGCWEDSENVEQVEN